MPGGPVLLPIHSSYYKRKYNQRFIIDKKHGFFTDSIVINICDKMKRENRIWFSMGEILFNDGGLFGKRPCMSS